METHAVIKTITIIFHGTFQELEVGFAHILDIGQFMVPVPGCTVIAIGLLSVIGVIAQRAFSFRLIIAGNPCALRLEFAIGAKILLPEIHPAAFIGSVINHHIGNNAGSAVM